MTTKPELDFTKPELLQTRGGQSVRIYATDGGGAWPIHGAVKKDNIWAAASWATDGYSNNQDAPDAFDLIPKPKRVTGWVNVYKNSIGQVAPKFGDTMFSTKESASGSAIRDFGCIGQIYIDAEVQQ